MNDKKWKKKATRIADNAESLWLRETTDPERRAELRVFIKYFKEHRMKYVKYAAYCLLPSFLIGGFFSVGALAIGGEYEVTFNPIRLILYGASGGFGMSLFVLLLMFGGVSMWRTRKNVKIEQMDDRGFSKSLLGTYGTSDFMKEDEKKKALIKNSNLERLTGNIFGYDPEDGKAVEINPRMEVVSQLNFFKFVCGSSGMGKTYSVVLPDLLQCIKRGESFLCTDSKGGVYEELASLCKEEGYTVKVMNTIHLLNSDGVDYMKYIVQDPTLAQYFGQALIMTTMDDDADRGDYFVAGELALTVFAVTYVATASEYKDEERTTGEVFNLLTTEVQPDELADFTTAMGKQTVPNALARMDWLANRLDDNHPARKQWKVFKATPPNALGSIWSGVTGKLQILGDPLVRSITSNDDIDITLPAREKCAYFVIASDNDSTYNFLISLFYTFFFNRIITFADAQHDKKVQIPVNLMLDEFPNTAKIPGFVRIINTCRSRGIRCTIIAQDLGEMMDNYKGHRWESIIGACDTMMLLGYNDHSTNGKWWSDKTGTMTVINQGSDSNHGGDVLGISNEGKRRLTMVGRPVMTPEEIQQMGRQYALVFLNGYNVLKVKKIGYPDLPLASRIKKENPVDHVPAWWEEIEAEYKENANDPSCRLKYQWFIDAKLKWKEDRKASKEAKERAEANRSGSMVSDALMQYDVNEEDVNEFSIKTKNAISKIKNVANEARQYAEAVEKKAVEKKPRRNQSEKKSAAVETEPIPAPTIEEQSANTSALSSQAQETSNLPFQMQEANNGNENDIFDDAMDTYERMLKEAEQAAQNSAINNLPKKSSHVPEPIDTEDNDVSMPEPIDEGNDLPMPEPVDNTEDYYNEPMPEPVEIPEEFPEPDAELPFYIANHEDVDDENWDIDDIAMTDILKDKFFKDGKEAISGMNSSHKL